MRKALSVTFVVLMASLSLVIGGCRDPVAPATTRLSADVGTVGLWHFNEGSGQAVTDSSSTGWDLWLGETTSVEFVDPEWTAEGRFGGGLGFTGGNSEYVKGPGQSAFSGNQITIEFWIKTSNIFTSNPAIGSLTGTFQLNADGLLQVSVGDTDWRGTVTATTAINDGQWHYIAMVYDGTFGDGTLSLYIDGSIEDSESPLNCTLADLTAWHIGGRPSFSYVDGIMDEVRVSNIARTASEIAANY
jgi:hypothetical protein